MVPEDPRGAPTPVDDRGGDPAPASTPAGASSPAAVSTPAAALSDEAFAATIAPQAHGTGSRSTDPPIADAVHGRAASDSRTVRASRRRPAVQASAIESDATMAAPLSAISDEAAAPALPPLPPLPLPPLPLPIVPLEHYRADDEIARGGMGRIVAAEDQRLGRRVALKELLEPAGDALGRFQREALITARLQHPGIVPVYEAGRWPSGEPFFAMKLVSGRPLDRVIAEARSLEARLALLPRIAAATDAIAYAHSQRVIHRDLKPGNILIGDFGETVVIDWGLAKDLDAGDEQRELAGGGDPTGSAGGAGGRPRGIDSPASGVRSPKPARPASASTTAASTLTVAGAVMGTPAYMAPEQARGEPVDQRADVFALGAMLYHLLAGVPPYNARTATDVIAAAALHAVMPLAEREPGVPRDLVAIVERAMAAQPAERYPDAGELAEELRRFLTGQLVSAHRYTAWQRLRRWIKKHQAAVTIAAIAIVAFVVAGTIAVRQIMAERDTARFERARADARRVAAEALIDKMLSDIKTRLVRIGRLDLLADLGNQIHAYYRTLGTTPGGMPISDVYRMAVAVELVGRAERDSGDAARALETWTQVRDQIVELIGDDRSPATLGPRAMVARLEFQIGTIHQGYGKAALAIAQYERAKQQFAGLLAEAAGGHARGIDDARILLHAAENHDRLGDLLRNQGKLEEALDEYTAAQAARKRASAKPADRTAEEVLGLATSHLKIGSIHQARADTATAFAAYRDALRLLEGLLAKEPDNIEALEGAVSVQDTIAELQRQSGESVSAVRTYEAAVPIIESMIARDPTNTTWKRQHGNLLADLGFALLDTGAFQRGLEVLERAIAHQQDLVARDPKNTSWRVDLSRSFTRAGDAHLHLGEIAAAIAKFERGLELRRALAKLNPKSAPYRRLVAWSHAKLGNAYMQKADAARAIRAHEEALVLRARLVRESPGQSAFRNELATSELVLGKLLAARDPRRSAELIGHALDRARSLVAGDAINNEWKETLTRGLLARADAAKLAGDRAARRAALDEAYQLAKPTAEASPHNPHWPGFLAEIHAGLAEVAPDARAAAAEWRAVRELLEPLAAAGKLSATRKDLLARAQRH